MSPRRLGLSAVLLIAPLAAGAASPAATTPLTDDYPTEARADYVLACMAVNGGTQPALRSCSCAIDVIATVLPYHSYETADTILRMRRIGGGYLSNEFHVASANAVIQQLQEAQAEADVRCF